jgi:hypothetical protein
MKLSVNVAVKGGYITAGSELPADFELPDHLKPFVVEEVEDDARRTLSPASDAMVDEHGGAETEAKGSVKQPPPRKFSGLRK